MCRCLVPQPYALADCGDLRCHSICCDRDTAGRWHSAHRADICWGAHAGLARRVELFVLAEAKVCYLEDWCWLLPRLGLLQLNESVFELQVSMCEALVVYELHSSHELLEEETSHVLIKAVRSLHSLEELPSCGILQHESQVLVRQENLQV